MSIRFTCPKCGHSDKARNEFAGQKVKCPSCRQILTVPDPNAPSAAGVGPPPQPASSDKPGWWSEPSATDGDGNGQVPPTSDTPLPQPASKTHIPPAAKSPPPTPPKPPESKPAGWWSPEDAIVPGAPTSPRTEDVAAAMIERPPPPKPPPPPPPEPPAPTVADATPPPRGEQIKVVCPHCDCNFTVEVSKAGKNVPCLDCGKLVRAPKLEDLKEKSWRDVQKLPSMARVDTQPAPEGAWTAPSVVSGEAIRQAAMLEDDDDEPLTWTQRLLRVTAYGLLLAGLIYGGLAAWRYRGEVKQVNTIELALAPVFAKDDEAKLSPQQKGAICRLAGRHARLAGDARESLSRLDRARALLVSATPSAERSLLLAEVALEMAGLFDAPVEMERREQTWNGDAVARKLGQTLTAMPAETATDREIRIDVARRLARQMVHRTGDPWDHFVRALRGSAHTPDRTEVLAGVGLELVTAGRTDEAKKIAADAAALLASTSRGKDGKPAPLPPLPLLLGLYVALDDSGNAKKLGPVPGQGSLNPTTRLGYAEGWARVGKLAEARKLALTPVRAGEPLDDMLRALASIAEVDRLTEADQALIERLPAAPWPERRRPLVLYRLARLMADAGQPELAHALAGRIADASLQACARLEAYRGELVAAVAETPAPPETLQKLASAGSAPSGLAQALASHHEARHSKPNVLAQAQAMENPARPFAIAGVALGWQAALPVRGSDSSPSPETR